ncbi:TetR/AcrR family transcriptional regulator [Kineococcus rubinsiae]|uniref:TetR/AcrR family transcriptional regulator n=1 Tax=Kineococcus rubinsiae TaxID=2609562 RepID=UPI0014310665|nr:TetR/AcrR family transcriptional regulator [Kineococcus rubinsiae]NIZ90245.1 TetR/AcrR family transcriptional regulator [Kineococcus rubinsiae]
MPADPSPDVSAPAVAAPDPAPAAPAEPGRGRRTPRPSGDDRERAILATAEQLLTRRPYADVSVDELARGAGISRPTFYFYFPSKEAVLLALLDAVVAEARLRRDTALRHPAPDREGRWRQVIASVQEPFRSHRAVTLAAAEARASSPAVRDVWSAHMERFVEEAAAEIDAERARGAAPAGLPSRDLATALNWMNERVLHTTFAGHGPAVAEADVVDVLLGVWLRAIYGEPHPR